MLFSVRSGEFQIDEADDEYEEQLMPVLHYGVEKHRARAVSFVSTIEWAHNQPRNTDYRDLKPYTLPGGKWPPTV